MSFERLSKDVWFALCSFLDFLELKCVSQVCKQTRDILLSKEVYVPIFRLKLKEVSLYIKDLEENLRHGANPYDGLLVNSFSPTKDNQITLSHHKLVAEVRATELRKSKSCLLSKDPLLPLFELKNGLKVGYYEVEVSELDGGFVSVGLCEKEFGRHFFENRSGNTYLGWKSPFFSMGFHGDDGRLFTPADSPWNGRFENWGPRIVKGDTIGCGIVFDDKCGGVFFSVNGVLLSRRLGDHCPDSKIAYSFSSDLDKTLTIDLSGTRRFENAIREGFCAGKNFFEALQWHAIVAFPCNEVKSQTYKAKVKARFSNFNHKVFAALEEEGALYATD